MNMAMSVDGKISTHLREPIALGSKTDKRLMDTLRSQVDAVIIGAETLKVDGYPLLVRDSETRHRRVSKGLPPHPINVLLSRTLEVPIQRKFFRHEETRRIVFTTAAADAERVQRIKKYAEVVVLPKETFSLLRVLEALSSRGVNSVLVEGGGEVNFSFFREGLVDELYVTVTPRILGGSEAPTIADGTGFRKDDHLQLELISAKRIGDEVFLRYRVKNG